MEDVTIAAGSVVRRLPGAPKTNCSTRRKATRRPDDAGPAAG